MAFPGITDGDLNLNITEDKAKDLLLTSIAFEALGLAHLISVEAEKIQSVLGTLSGQTVKNPTVDELESISKAVESIMREIIKKGMLLQSKLQDVLAIPMTTPAAIPAETAIKTIITATTTTTTTTSATTTTTTTTTTNSTTTTTTTTTKYHFKWVIAG